MAGNLEQLGRTFALHSRTTYRHVPAKYHWHLCKIEGVRSGTKTEHPFWILLLWQWRRLQTYQTHIGSTLHVRPIKLIISLCYNMGALLLTPQSKTTCTLIINAFIVGTWDIEPALSWTCKSPITCIITHQYIIDVVSPHNALKQYAVILVYTCNYVVSLP